MRTLPLVPLLLALGACTIDPIRIDCPTPNVSFASSAAADAPFAVGAVLSMLTERSDGNGNVLETLSLESSDPAVIEVLAGEPGTLRAIAHGAGSAELIVRRQSGDEQGRASLTVAAPTSYELYSVRALLAGVPQAEALAAVPRLVVGTSATFFVRALDGADELVLGGGIVTYDVGTPGSVTLARFGSTVRGSLSPATSGAHDTPITWQPGLLAYEPATTLQRPVVGVEESEVTSLTLLAQDEAGAEEGTCRSVVSLGRDAEGEVIEGATASFDELSGGRHFGEGAVLGYRYQAASPVTLRASIGAATADAAIHAEPGSSSASAASGGCSLSHAHPSILPALGMMALGMAALAARRRRLAARI